MKTDNELIAEFMGLEQLSSADHLYRYPIPNFMEIIDKRDMLYNSSWDWLMPVIDKIEKVTHHGISFNCEINKSDCEIAWTVRPTGKKAPKSIKFKTDDGFGRDSQK